MICAVAHPPSSIQGKSTTFTTSKGVVSFGPNVTFGSNSVVIVGDKTIIGGVVQGPGEAQQPPLAGAGDAKPTSVSHTGMQQPEVKFAKSASAPCKQAGSEVPVKILSKIKQPSNIAIGKNGEIVVALRSDPSIIIFSQNYERVAEIDQRTASYACVAVDADNNILTFSPSEMKKFDMTGHELVSSRQDQKRMSNPCAVAIGCEGRFYIADLSEKCVHILEADFTYQKSIANGTRAYDVAINSKGYVYVPDQKKNKIRVFTCDGDLLFQFGDPGRAPIPHMAILVPMALCIGRDDRVYVGSGMNYIAVFSGDGEFVEKIGSGGSEPGQFSSLPRPLCIDQHRDLLYAGDEKGKRIQIFDISSD